MNIGLEADFSPLRSAHFDNPLRTVHFDNPLRWNEHNIRTLMGTTNETLNHLISKLLNKKWSDYLGYFRTYWKPSFFTHFERWDFREYLLSKNQHHFFTLNNLLAIKEKGHSFRYSSYPCWFMSRKFSSEVEGIHWPCFGGSFF